MLKMSFGTAPLGLSEPLFYPEYWHPPTLFKLGETTGLDIESIMFSFAVGGLASCLYGLFGKVSLQPVGTSQRHLPRHRFHLLALSAPVGLFIFFELVTPWNVIYTASLSLLGGGFATILCRPDLLKLTLKGSIIFCLFYILFFSSMVMVHPNIVTRFWNADVLSGWRIMGVPVEEILFAGTLGLMWSSFYEHRHWLRIKK